MSAKGCFETLGSNKTGLRATAVEPMERTSRQQAIIEM
jgi:hypothetical protein